MPQPRGRPTISQGFDGWWHCYFTVGQYPSGRPKRKHIRRATPGEVKTELDRLEDNMRRGAGVVTKVETVAAWLEHWLENVVRPNRAFKTFEAYRPIVRVHLVPLIGARRLDGRNRLEPEHVEAAYTMLRKRGMADLYVLQCHRVLRRALKEATRRGKASRNVCDMIDAPSARAKKIEAHTLAEAQAIITAAADDPMAVRWMLGLYVGLRQGEVLGLRWHRVHLDAKVPYLEVATQSQRRPWQHGCDDPHQCGFTSGKKTKAGKPTSLHRFTPCKMARWGKHKGHCATHTGVRGCPPLCPPGCTGHAQKCPHRRGGGMHDVDLKSAKSSRDLALDGKLVELLRAHREQQIRDRADLRRQWDPKGLVFTGPLGQALDPRRDYGAWQDLLARAGLPPSRLHAARHTAGTLMVATGTDIRAVQEILGHTDIRVTERYVDVARELKAEAVNRVAAALFDGALADLVHHSGATVKGDR